MGQKRNEKGNQKILSNVLSDEMIEKEDTTYQNLGDLGKAMLRGKLTTVIAYIKTENSWDFPGGAVVKNLPANAGNMDLIPGPGRSYMTQSN